MTPLPLADRETAVYRLFAADDTLLYVGISWNTEQRFKAHASTKQWWASVVRQDIEWHPDRFSALKLEAKAIQAEAPLHNSDSPNPERVRAPKSAARHASATHLEGDGFRVSGQYLTVEDLADRLGMAPKEVGRGVRSRGWPHSLVGRQIRFSPEQAKAIEVLAQAPAQAFTLANIGRALKKTRARTA